MELHLVGEVRGEQVLARSNIHMSMAASDYQALPRLI